MKKLWHDLAWDQFLSGWWSVRIDSANRIVFRIEDGELIIRSCKGHYE